MKHVEAENCWCDPIKIPLVTDHPETEDIELYFHRREYGSKELPPKDIIQKALEETIDWGTNRIIEEN